MHPLVTPINAEARSQSCLGCPLDARGLWRRGQLGALPRAEWRALLGLSHGLGAAAGEQLLGEGDDPGSFFVIESGRASIRRAGRHLGLLGPGDFFGEVALLEGQPHTSSVVALTDMRLRVVPACGFRLATTTFPAFARVVRATGRERLSLKAA
jgi:CRP-like cAMP-binding protein